MSELKLIHGKQSIKYNLFKDYEFEGCRAIAARLMGVTALKVTWRSKDDKKSSLCQIIHLDYSEYGIDEYQEFEITHGSADYKLKKEEMNHLWHQFASVMGSEITDINAACMLRLIDSALPFADDSLRRSYDNDENREFRDYAKLRLSLMKEALSDAGISVDDCTEEAAIAEVSPLSLTAFETINYFIMRLVDGDLSAASTLTSIKGDDLKECPLTKPGRQTLISCNIALSDKSKDAPSDGESYPFRCKITTEADDGYHHATFVIWLSGNHRAKDPLVTELKIGSQKKLSDYEAAFQINSPEFITVFKCSESMLRGFDIRFISPFEAALHHTMPNGMLYTAYKKDNSHVDSQEYRIGGDVLGCALLSLAGELVLMSNELSSITRLDDATIISMYSPSMQPMGRYRLDTSVFQTLCNTPGLSFADMVEPETE